MMVAHEEELKSEKAKSDEYFQQMQREVEVSAEQNSMISVMQKKLLDEMRHKLKQAEVSANKKSDVD